MTKNSFISLVLLVAIVIVIFVVFDSEKNTDHKANNNQDVIELSLNNATFKIPDTDIEVAVFEDISDSIEKNYYATFDDSISKGSISVLGDYLLETSLGESVVPFVVDFGGSGRFFYLAELSVGNGAYKHIDSEFLGDRIKIVGIYEGENNVTVSFLTRNVEESFASEPTTPAYVVFGLSKTELNYERKTINASLDDVVIENLSFNKDKKILSIEGKAKGPWYFEANLPIKINNTSGENIISTYTTTEDDWMTSDYVAFKKEIELKDNTETSLLLVIENDNPSGMAEYQKIFEMPISLE